MEILALAGGFAFLAVFGFWIMGKVGRFLAGGGCSPYWDEAEERKAADREQATRRGADASIQKRTE